MINCKNCINWVDESLDQIEADHNAHPHIFMGCRIFGFLVNSEELPECRHYQVSENLFTICNSCHITVSHWGNASIARTLTCSALSPAKGAKTAGTALISSG